MLERELGSWIRPHLISLRCRQDLRKVDLEMAHWVHLPWERRIEFDRRLPNTLLVPSGRTIPIDYRSGTPVLAVKLQEMFGCATTPRLLEGDLPITI